MCSFIYTANKLRDIKVWRIKIDLFEIELPLWTFTLVIREISN